MIRRFRALQLTNYGTVAISKLREKTKCIIQEIIAHLSADKPIYNKTILLVQTMPFPHQTTLHHRQHLPRLTKSVYLSFHAEDANILNKNSTFEMGIKTNITLYTEGTPNGLKPTILLAELGLEYKVGANSPQL